MKPKQIVELILTNKPRIPVIPQATAFAPANIALCKYWGKRNNELNLPVTDSLSIALANKGATTTISISQLQHDEVKLNGELIATETEFAKRLSLFLDLFRTPHQYFSIDTSSNIPIAAGLASSASGFAALVKALNDLFNWQLTPTALSILARLGSGSACRSLWNGLVKWHAGRRADGMDSFAEPLPYQWSELRIGLLLVSSAKKTISSREAMQRSVNTSKFYAVWSRQVEEDLRNLEIALQNHYFHLLGKAAEANALAMHAIMHTSDPVIFYSQPQTIELMHKIWDLRANGLPVYFTQDAGPNLKLLFLQSDEAVVRESFPNIEIIAP